MAVCTLHYGPVSMRGNKDMITLNVELSNNVRRAVDALILTEKSFKARMEHVTLKS